MRIKPIRRALLVLLPALLLTACAPGRNVSLMYDAAVRDAAVVEENEVSSGLVPVDPSNEALVWNADRTKILVSTWKSRTAYEKFIKPDTRTSDSAAYAVWVTAVPQVRRFCGGWMQDRPGADAADLDLRLKQYLGLHPNWHYDLFVEMWVRPQDLFRPCVDPEVGDASCNVAFGNEDPAVRGIADYPEFYRSLYFKSFRTPPGVPWTGLGYTYDWGNPASDAGASEFILVPGAEYEIKQAVPTTAYCHETED